MPAKRQLVTAQFKATFSNQSIDKENGIIRGVMLMEVGKTAKFQSVDGVPRQVVITSEHIDALLSHAGNRSIPAHSTHEWLSAQDKPNADSVEMNARVAAFKSLQKDSAGNLRGDMYLKEGDSRRDIIFGAEHNPDDNMISVVFGFLKDDPLCIPQNFRAADLVPQGAATTGMFSESNPNENKTMDINELITMLSDPAVKDALKAVIKSVEANMPDPADDAAADTAEMEADVKPEDKKSDDDKKPAMLRASLRIFRAGIRQTTAMLKASEGKSKTEAEALITAKMGGVAKFIESTGEDAAKDGEAFITAQLAAGCKTRAMAIARMGRDKPELYATFRS